MKFTIVEEYAWKGGTQIQEIPLEEYAWKGGKIQEITPEKAQQFMDENCQQFIKSVGDRVLYRGANYPVVAQIVTPPEKRLKPRDMPVKWHEYLDEEFFKKFGWHARTEGIFCTGNWSQARSYGPVYKIIPVDGYKFLWSMRVYDLYSKFVDVRGILCAENSWKPINFDAMKIPTKEINKVKNTLRNIVGTYQTTDLYKGLVEGKEIMLKCDKYLAIEDD